MKRMMIILFFVSSMGFASDQYINQLLENPKFIELLNIVKHHVDENPESDLQVILLIPKNFEDDSESDSVNYFKNDCFTCKFCNKIEHFMAVGVALTTLYFSYCLG